MSSPTESMPHSDEIEPKQIQLDTTIEFPLEAELREVLLSKIIGQ